MISVTTVAGSLHQWECALSKENRREIIVTFRRQAIILCDSSAFSSCKHIAGYFYHYTRSVKVASLKISRTISDLKRKAWQLYLYSIQLNTNPYCLMRGSLGLGLILPTPSSPGRAMPVLHVLQCCCQGPYSHSQNVLSTCCSQQPLWTGNPTQAKITWHANSKYFAFSLHYPAPIP